MRKAFKYSGITGAVFTALTFSSAIAAGEAADVSGGASSAPSDLVEIVVTAQKRSERLQDIPLSVSAVTEQSLNEQGITQFTDLVSREPGLHLSQDNTQSTFTIRGISSSTSADTTSATAGIYIDDFPLYDTWFRFASPDIHLFDVERVEVLRGPQGTLYGATSLSGSVRIITNKPDLNAFGAKFEGTGSSTDGGKGNYEANGMVNIPLIDGVLGVRAVAYARGEGGYIDNVLRGANVNGKQSYGGRLDVAAQPAEDWNILWSLFIQHDVHDDQDGSFYYPPPGQTNLDLNSVLPTRVQSDLFVSTLAVDKKLGANDLNVTATVGYDQSNNLGDGTPISTALGFPIPTPFAQPSHAHNDTLEARFSSDASQSLRYIVGLYYNTRYRTLQQDADQAALAPVFGTSNIYTVIAAQRATEVAAYGEGTWEFAPQWEATLGLRVFNNNYKFNSNVTGLLNSVAAPLVPSLTNLSNSNTSATPRVSLSYKPSKDLNLYATVSEGYRFGLTNYNSGANEGIPLSYKPDTLWNFELGAKATFLDGRASLNSSLYYELWHDMQISFRNSNGQVYITNAGNARSYGLENELVLRPVPEWAFNATLTLGEAAMTSDNPGILQRAASIRGPAEYGVYSGMRLPGSERISGSAGIQYNLLHTLGAGDAYIRVDDVYVGASYVDFTQVGSLKIGDYNLVNLRAGYRFKNYEVVLFSDNLFNSRGVENAVPDADLTGLTDWAYRVKPRTIGLTFRAKY
jgi:iron complex outermembrane recepter protein